MNWTLHSKPMLKRSLYSLMFPDGRLLVLFTPEDQTLFPKPSLLQRELLLLADGQVTIEDMITTLRERGIPCSEEEVFQALHFYAEKLLLEDSAESSDESLLSDYLKEKYDRQLLYFAAQNQHGRQYALNIQRTLQNTHILIIGVGCFGSHVLYGLSAAGIGKITLVDFDTVELSNLNRQSMYTEQDVGKPKLEALKERSKSLSSSTTYAFIEKKITSVADFVHIIEDTTPDLVVLTADSPREKIQPWMNEACYETGIPTIFTLGVTQAFMRIGPLVVPGRTACYDCSMPNIAFDYDDPLIQFINNQHIHGVIAPHVMMAAGIMTLEILKHLTGFAPCMLYSNRIILNAFTYKVLFQKTKRRLQCPFCGEKNVAKLIQAML